MEAPYFVIGVICFLVCLLLGYFGATLNILLVLLRYFWKISNYVYRFQAFFLYQSMLLAGIQHYLIKNPHLVVRKTQLDVDSNNNLQDVYYLLLMPFRMLNNVKPFAFPSEFGLKKRVVWTTSLLRQMVAVNVSSQLQLLKKTVCFNAIQAQTNYL